MTHSTRQFIRHYVEMVVAMLLGMVVLGPPAEVALRALGSSTGDLHTDAPAVALLGMAAMMTAPMVGWMRYRGHGWRANTEMSASMFVPTFAVISVLTTGLLTDIGILMAAEHVVMLLAMAGVMLLRPDEYIHHDHAQVTA
jgi:hypothetical protein